MSDLMPLTETWLERERFVVSTVANRINATKKTGFLSSENIVIFFEDSSNYCSVKLQGSLDVCQRLGQYLQSLPPKEKANEQRIIIKERETVSVPCPYCQTLVSVTEKRCPNCGAYVRG